MVLHPHVAKNLGVPVSLHAYRALNAVFYSYPYLGVTMKSVITSLMIVSAALTLSACSEELTAQAKKAATEVATEANKAAAGVATEANKAATQKIEEAKNDAIGQLKELKAGTEAKKEEKGAQADSKTTEEKTK